VFSREKIAKIAGELADHLQVIENIRSLQTGQRELADAIKFIAGQVDDIQTELRALKAETRLEAPRETQGIVNAVQGGLNQRIEDLAVKVAIVESQLPRSARIEDRPSPARRYLVAPGGANGT
jgi:hypothetical protein